MRLELLVEEQTPEAVVEHLAEGIQKSFRSITDVVIEKVGRYALPSVSVCRSEEEIWELARQKIGHMCEEGLWKNGEIYSVFVDGVDVMVEPSRSGKVNLRYYNLMQLLAQRHNNSEGADKFLLVGTHHRFFEIEADVIKAAAKIYASTIVTSGVLCRGFWSDWYNGGVVHLAKTPKPGNVWVASHELGHALGAGHPHDLADRNVACVMQVGISYAKKGKLLEFCDPCKDAIGRFAAK